METRLVFLPRVGPAQPWHDRVDELGGILKSDEGFGLQGIGQVGRQLISVGFFELSR